MAKKISKLLIILFVMLTLVCILSPMSKIYSAKASTIQGVAGNNIVLTGLAGKNPIHFFYDADDESTLVNAKAKNLKEKYYSIVSSGSGESYGWSEISPTVDMQTLIEKGLLYAQASASITVKNDTKMTLKISSGESFEQTTASGGEIATPLLQIKDLNQKIRFTFEATQKNGKPSFVMNLPTIHLYTIIDSVTLEDEDQIVSPGQIVKVNAYNDVTEISGASGNFISFSKINHKINFEFVSGEKYAQVVGNNLVISEDAPQGETIKFRVFSNKNSFSTQKIYSSNYVTFTVDTNNVNVKVRTDFKNPAKIYGEGIYEKDRRITLNIEENPDFQFEGWYIDGKFRSDETELIISAVSGQDIYARFIKTVSVKSISVASRVYDGTKDIDENDVDVIFEGVENEHEVGIQGATFSFGDESAGKNKVVTSSFEKLTLTGENADIYRLRSQNLPSGVGEIIKRDVVILPQEEQSKEYGDNDPEILYTAQNVVEGETLRGGLSREEGEKLGKYLITTGNLAEENPNYNFFIETDVRFEIVQRKVSLGDVVVQEKVYDGGTEATIKAEVKNVLLDEDVGVQIKGEFLSSNVGSNIEVRIVEATLVGADKDNYVLEEYTQKLYGSISKKAVCVKALSCTYVYGYEISLPFEIVNGENDDFWSGKLSLKDVSALQNVPVGEYSIEVGNLSHPNYFIENFETAICKITPRTAYVEADEQVKTFGEKDPALSYKIFNIIEGDEFSGKLQRQAGEDFGLYEINQGSLSNPNYEISFTKNFLKINPRKIVVAIRFLDKEYDGSNHVDYEIQYIYNIKEEIFDSTIVAELQQTGVGTAAVKILSQETLCEKIENYTFSYTTLNNEIEITKRAVNVFVDNSKKIYGDQDPTFTYSAKNLVAGEEIDIEITRSEGENVGFYSYSLKEENEDKNPNYKIYLVDSMFQITPRSIHLFVRNQTKTFGDIDPLIEFTVVDQLYFNDTVEQVCDGKVLREKGEKVGVYNYDFSQVSTGKNYTFLNSGETNFIIMKRPVVVTSFATQKTYGYEDPIFEYKVLGDIEGERLTVQISREYGENVGEYWLVCDTTNDPRYTITFNSSVLKILPCPIKLKADKKIKIYGEKDPAFSVTVISGFLKYNDRVNDLISGSMTREEGEDVGTYKIGQGSLTFGDNYLVSFEEGELEILQRNISIFAREEKKTYGDEDPILTYEISEGGLAFNDEIQGSLVRENGENVGTYEILLGDIKVNENYIVDFVGNRFSILKKEIEIVPTTVSKEYGEKDEAIDYEIEKGMVGDDQLSGCLYRQQKNGDKDETGKYRIVSTLFNENYEIIFGEYYFTILPRKVVVQAKNYKIYYGDKDPKLEYEIVDGTILDGDKISGSLHRLKGNTAGVYDIISSLTLGRNYNLEYVKGTVTILPKKLTLQSTDYTKFYGQDDPTFVYKIVEGELINNDVLYGAIIRENGEDVGSYNLESAIYNANYEITLLPCHLEILKKNVSMVSAVYNKIYDGTTNARLKNPYITGLIDPVYLEYEKDNCADFESPNVGEHIKVYVHDISLTGEKSGNYNLVLPEVLFADITYEEIEREQVKISAKDPVLSEDCMLEVTSEKVSGVKKIQNHQLVSKYEIWIQKGLEKVDVESTFSITIDLPSEIYSRNNIYVYQQVAEGKFVLLSSQKENGQLIIKSSALGSFYITVEDEMWVDYVTIWAIAIISFVCVFAVITTMINSRRKRKLRK